MDTGYPLLLGISLLIEIFPDVEFLKICKESINPPAHFHINKKT